MVISDRDFDIKECQEISSNMELELTKLEKIFNTYKMQAEIFDYAIQQIDTAEDVIKIFQRACGNI